MKKILLFVLGLSALSSFAAIPTTAGWYQIPNTAINNVCACTHGFSQVCGATGCGGIFAWGSGVFDTKRNRHIFWGGGHNDYYGNEIYSLNLDALTMTRITDPTIPVASGCTYNLTGNTPNSRHTYDHIAYAANVDKLFSFAGSISCPTSGVFQDTWLFNFATMKWEYPAPSGTKPRAGEGMVSAYDPNTGKVFFQDLTYLFAYNPVTNAWERFDGSASNGVDYHLCATVDPKRKKFVMIGSGQCYVYDISATSTYAFQTLSTTGGSGIVGSSMPGIAYDPVRDRIVGWNGGNTVYSLNMDTKQWTSDTYTGGPGSANTVGIYGRWDYSPALDCFVLVNTTAQNAYAFRFPGSGASVNKRPAIAPSLTLDVSPNPVSGAALIRINGSAEQLVSLAVYDTRGRMVENLANQAKDAAGKEIAWNTRALSCGVYVLEARTATYSFSKRILLSK